MVDMEVRAISPIWLAMPTVPIMSWVPTWPVSIILTPITAD